MRALALAIFALILVAPAGAVPPPAVVPAPAVAIDGDDLMVGDRRIRLWGIDAPEMRGENGHRARATLDDLIAGQRVRCQPVNRDRYDRLVARCSTAATPDLGEAMLRNGAATVYRRFTVGSELAERYDAAERAARTARIGIWATRQATRESNGNSERVAKALERLAAEAETVSGSDIWPLVASIVATAVIALGAAFLGAREGAKGAARATLRGVKAQATLDRIRARRRIAARRDQVRVLLREETIHLAHHMVEDLDSKMQALIGLSSAERGAHLATVHPVPIATYPAVLGELGILGPAAATRLLRFQSFYSSFCAAVRESRGRQVIEDDQAQSLRWQFRMACEWGGLALNSLCGRDYVPFSPRYVYTVDVDIREHLWRIADMPPHPRAGEKLAHEIGD